MTVMNLGRKTLLVDGRHRDVHTMVTKFKNNVDILKCKSRDF